MSETKLTAAELETMRAAAPELFAALAKWQDVMTKNPPGPAAELIDAEEMARAALAKARG